MEKKVKTNNNGNNTSYTIIIEKIYCKYSSKEDFMRKYKARRIALERAITIYVAEGMVWFISIL